MKFVSVFILFFQLVFTNIYATEALFTIISCDINNTITNAPDTAQESIRGPLSFEYRVGKTVAESLYTTSPGKYEEFATLADYIKAEHKESRDTIFADLTAHYHLYQAVLSETTAEKISELLSQVSSCMRTLESQPFPIFEKFYSFAEKYTQDPNAVLVMQTFGDQDILVQAALRARGIAVDDTIGTFDEHHVLTYRGTTYEGEAIIDLLLSNPSQVWLFKTCYREESGPLAKHLFERSDEPSVNSVLIDDNVLEYLQKNQLCINGQVVNPASPPIGIKRHLLKAVAATLMIPEGRNPLIDFVECARYESPLSLW